MQAVDTNEIGDSIASVIEHARYDGMYGYREMVRRAGEHKMNGIAVSRSGKDTGGSVAILVEGRLHCMLFSKEEGMPEAAAALYPMQKEDEYALFAVDETEFPDLLTTIWRLDSQGGPDTCIVPESEGSFYCSGPGGSLQEINSSVLGLDRSGRVLSLNRFGEEYFGFAEEEIRGRHAVGTIVPERDACGEDMRILIDRICRSSGDHPTRTIENRTRDGRRVWNAWTYAPLRDGSGDCIGVLCVGNDVTEEMEHHRDAGESEEKFRLLVEHSPNMVFFNRDGKILYANGICEEILGYSRDELYSSGFSFLSLIAPEYRESCRRSFAEAFGLRRVPACEYTLLTRDRKRLDVVLSTQVVTYRGEEAIIGVVTDITERKSVEKKIRESENHYRAIFETTGTAMMIVNEDGTISLANAEFEHLFGYSSGELEGRKFWKSFFVHEEHEKLRLWHHLRRKDPSSAPRTYESRLVDCTGGRRDILMTVSLIPDTANSVVSIIDITGRKNAERALRESEERYRLLAENAKDVIWTMNMDLEFTYISPSVRSLLGYGSEELMRKRLDRLLTPPSLQYVREVFFEERALDQVPFGTRRGLRSLEFECIRSDGSFLWVEAKVTFLRDENRRPLSILGVARDISERKQIERIKSEAFAQIEKNMEQFAVLNDHIRNPLQAIVGLADLEGGDLAEKIFQQAMEIDAIIKRLDIGWIESRKIREFLLKHYQQEGGVCR
jgi:PAS domain S-box-containing protein